MSISTWLLIVGVAGLVFGGICLLGMCWEIGKAAADQDDLQ